MKVGHISFLPFSICVGMRQYFYFYILRWSTNLHKLSNFSRIFSVGLLKAMCGALDWSVVAPLKKQFFSKNNAHNTLDLEPLTRVRLMLHQSQAPTNGRPADQHYKQWKLTPDKYILRRKFIPRCIITLSTQIRL